MERPARPLARAYPAEEQLISSDPFGPLRLRFAARCRDQLARLKAVSCNPRELATGTNALQGIVHSLAGSGGIFGFPQISEAALRLDVLLSGETNADPVELRAALDVLIGEIERIPE